MLLLLPLLVVRGLLPVGFMLSFDSGRPALVYCPAQGQSIQSQDAAYHQHHHGHAGHGSSDHAAHDNAPCPFALAASMAPPCVVPTSIFSGIVLSTISLFSDDLFTSHAAAHAHPIRGPPALA
jgi:hypothetical protein